MQLIGKVAQARDIANRRVANAVKCDVLTLEEVDWASQYAPYTPLIHTVHFARSEFTGGISSNEIAHNAKLKMFLALAIKNGLIIAHGYYGLYYVSSRYLRDLAVLPYSKETEQFDIDSMRHSKAVHHLLAKKFVVTANIALKEANFTARFALGTS